MKARTRVAAAILAFAALPLILVNTGSLADRRDDAARNADLLLSGNADETAALLAAMRTRWLESVRADARLPIFEEILSDGGKPAPLRLSRFFAAVGSRDTVNIAAIGVLDLQGRVVVDSLAANEGRDESLEPWFLRVVDSGQPQMIGPIAAAGESRPGLYVTALIRDGAEQRRGVLRMRVEPATLGQVMASALVANPGLSATLIDEDGRRLAGVGPLGEASLPAPEDPSLLRGGATPTASARVLTLGAERVAIESVANAPWRVVVRQPLAAWAAPQDQLRRDWWVETALLLVLLLGASVLLGRRIAAPLARFSNVAVRLAEGDYSPVPRWPGAEEARHLGEALDGLANRLRDTVGALRDSREQYLALVEQLPGAVYRCSDREGWPMEYLSPQIEQLTGFRPDELLADDAQGFTRLMLPEDLTTLRPVVSDAIRSEGRFDLRYRIRHRDGRLRWIWELGSAHPASEGRGASLTGVLFDVTERETDNQAMALLRGGVESRVGGDFFVALAEGLVRVLDVDTVMIGRFRGLPPTRVSSLALVHRDAPSEGREFDLAGTPTEATVAKGRVEIVDGVIERFPGDAGLARRGLRSYAGRRLDDSHGRPIGVLAVLHGQPMAADGTVGRLLDLFQARVAAELERVIAEEDLQRLAETLENRVAERTRELESANAALSQAMEQLVQREKLASLGSLVAGVAHELNTPIGNALTVSTALNDIHRAFAVELTSGSMKRSALDRFVAENIEATALIERNLKRAAELIHHFKQVAVDQASVRRRQFDLSVLVEDVLSTLSPLLRRSPHRVQVDIPTGLLLESYPGPLEQVLTNLIENSLIHAFVPGQPGVIHLSATAAAGRLRLRYADDGQGIPEAMRHRVFDPFFTTRLGQGGSGLGLYLVYNLVHGRLGGSIQLAEGDGPGACFIMDVPMVAPASGEETSA